MAKKPPLGTGERFDELVRALRRKKIKSPEALAAWIGRKKYGIKKFTELSLKGRKK